MVDHELFRLSLERLEERHEDMQRRTAALPDFIRESIAESVIQRFKTCYESP